MRVTIREVARTKKDWSLYRLAKEMEVSLPTIYSWAKGKTQPSYQYLDRICTVLDCGVEELFQAEKNGITSKRWNGR